MKPKQGILLLNLGTPDDCTTPAVRRYLAEFLMDPYCQITFTVRKFIFILLFFHVLYPGIILLLGIIVVEIPQFLIYLMRVRFLCI